MSDFGRIATSDDGYVLIEGTELKLWSWANRPNAKWPCSTLTNYTTVRATLHPDNGDLVDLIVWKAGSRWAEDSDDVDIDGNELTAWLDDVLEGSEFSHLRRGVNA